MRSISKSERLTTNPTVFAARLDGRKTRTLKKFYRKISDKLSFPDYFGHNMDALADCLCDLSWLEPNNVHLYIKNPDSFLSEEKKEIKVSILDILEEAQSHQIEDGRTFEAVAVRDDEENA